MKITPVTGPGAIKDLSTPETVRTARAVEAFNKASTPKQQTANTQEHPVKNANNISAEELGAVQATTVEQVDNSPKNVGDGQQAQEASQETVDAPTPTESPKEDPALSRQFAQLARQERALRAKASQQEQALKTREAAIAAKEAELASKGQVDLNEYIPKSRLRQDALGVLEAEGIATYDDLTQRAVTRQPIDPQLQFTIDKLNDKIAKLEAANEQSQKSATEQQQASINAAIKQIEMDARALIKNDPEFETIKATGAVKDVVDLITKTYYKHGIVLTVEDAAKEVEEQIIEEGLKIAKIEKIKKRMAQANASQASSTQKTQATKQQTQTGMKTLTNATASTRKLSAKERAILAFKGELKS